MLLKEYRICMPLTVEEVSPLLLFMYTSLVHCCFKDSNGLNRRVWMLQACGNTIRMNLNASQFSLMSVFLFFCHYKVCLFSAEPFKPL